MVRLQKYTFDRRALLIGAAVIGVAGSRTLAVADSRDRLSGVPGASPASGNR